MLRYQQQHVCIGSAYDTPLENETENSGSRLCKMYVMSRVGVRPYNVKSQPVTLFF